MPPPMPNPMKRITANPVRPARYRPGKAVPEDESSEEEEEEELEAPKKAPSKSQARAQPQRPRAPVRQEPEDEDDDEEGFVTEEDDDVPESIPKNISVQAKPTATTQPTIRTQPIASQPTANSQSDEEEESEEESEESSEEESSSEEEAPQRKFQRPTFIRKAERQKSSDPSAANNATQSLEASSSTPDIDEQTRRLAQADLYIKDKLERDAIARSQGRKAWDDDDELAPEDMVDDTDGLDPAAEYSAWKLRELKRLKRDREAIEAREKEIEELERRRNLTQEERDAEDREYIAKQKGEKEEGRGKASYLAKYHHKGAFFQDDEMAEIFKKRDIMGARFEDDIADKSTLPEYMRVRDMTKLGKKGRTRYTDLRGEDTGRFGENVKRWRGPGYQNDNGDSSNVDLRGVDERFLPDTDGRGRDVRGPTGANASAVGQRREGRYSRSRSPPSRNRRTDSRERGDSYRPRRRSRSYSSRSRTPPARRKRSPSPYVDREKRRRVEVD